ncbi:MAG: hypothetical protein HC800_23840 [Phormidesmis sp. RL_2_1]|nr:hypothetical protein [Phormidesmis sp. RL_2_1]
MTVIHEWTLKLAETVAPDEVYLAPSIAASYIASRYADETSGDSTQANSQSLNSTCEPCSIHLFLPLVLRSIEQASNQLVDMLSSPTMHDIVTNVIPLATLLIQFKECSLHEKSHAQAQHTMNLLESVEELDEKLANEYPACKEVVEDISNTLSNSGIPKEISEITAWKTFRQFVENQKSGLEYLRKLK